MNCRKIKLDSHYQRGKIKCDILYFCQRNKLKPGRLDLLVAIILRKSSKKFLLKREIRCRKNNPELLGERDFGFESLFWHLLAMTSKNAFCFGKMRLNIMK